MSILRIKPDASPTVLNVFLEHPFFPSGSPVAKNRIKQVLRTHRGKARIDTPARAVVDLVDRHLHVVANTTPWNTTQGFQGARMGIEQHFTTLVWVALSFPAS